MTFSLVGRCARTGMLGAVVTSSSPAVAARCAWARESVGAVCTQNITDPRLGTAVLDALGSGRTVAAALDEVMSAAAYPAYRQVIVVGADGLSAAYSGEHTLGRHRTCTATDAVAAGNLLADDEVPAAMLDAFTARPADHLGDRLLAALQAGATAGGEEGPVRSCGMLIVDRVPWAVTDLRVDWADDPIADLLAAWRVWAPQADDYVTRALDPRLAPSYGVPGDE